jgi:hypothetical protein
MARGLCLPFAADSPDCVCYAIGAGQELAVQGCGGPSRTGCPGDRCCADDPRDDCAVSPDSSCTGLCVAAGGCDPAQQACGICPQGIVQGPCEDVAGTRSFAFRSVGDCVTDQGSIDISRTFSGQSTVVQNGCSIQSDVPGVFSFTGTVSGSEVQLSSPISAIPSQRCPMGQGSINLAGEVLENGVIELEGTAAYVATCDGGSASCRAEIEITSQP